MKKTSDRSGSRDKYVSGELRSLNLIEELNCDTAALHGTALVLQHWMYTPHGRTAQVSRL